MDWVSAVGHSKAVSRLSPLVDIEPMSCQYGSVMDRDPPMPRARKYFERRQFADFETGLVILNSRHVSLVDQPGGHHRLVCIHPPTSVRARVSLEGKGHEGAPG
jgi:hypothetical protein